MQAIRQTIFMVKGLAEYTRSGYNRATRNFEADDLDVDLSGKSIAISGANSGIGLETACTLATKGAKILMICRDRSRGEVALEKIRVCSEQDNEPVLYILDMSKPRDVHKFVKDFISRGMQLDVLVNNAGCMIQQRSNVDGVETNFSTNTLGVYILTKGLLPILEKSDDPRVITVSSAGMYTQKLKSSNFSDNDESKEVTTSTNSTSSTSSSTKENRFDGTAVYAQNKRQQVVMMEEFALGYPNIFFATMHPGWADTEAVKTSMPGFYKVTQSMLRTAAQGADTVVWLCTMRNIHRKFLSGQFFQDRMIVSKHLPCCCTQSTPEENKLFINSLEKLSHKFN